MKDSLFQRASPRALAALLTIAGGAAPAVAHAQANIDTAQPAYLASGLGVTVNPVFQGGVLQTDQAGAYGQNFTLDGSGTNTIDQAGVATTFSGVISDAAVGTPGSLIIDDSVGGGDLTLSGASTYTGATTVRAGTLSLTGSIAGSSGVDLAGANAVFDVSHLSASTQINSLSGVAGSRVQLGSKGLTVNQAGATTFAGQISGAAGSGSGTPDFVKTGAGVLTLSGDNGYTNQTTISGGVLALSGQGSIAASSGVVDNAAFDISATTSGASITTLSGNGVVVLGSRNLTLTAAANTFDGVISGAGGVTIASGAETLTGVNTYTGVTTINGGASLSLTGAGAIANSGVTVNGTFDISATTSGAAIQSLSGSGHVVLGGETLLLTNASGTFSGDIAGNGGLALLGGRQTLSGANSYSGGTSISGGVLALTGSGTLGSPAGTLSLLGGVLDLGGTTQRVGVMWLGGGVIVDTAGGGALTASAYSVQSGDVGVVLAGSGSLTQNGSGATTLTRANTYTGLTTISSGTLALAGSGSISASSGVVDDGVLDISATNAGAAITRLSGHGAVALGAQTLTLTRAGDAFSGVIGGSGGGLTVGGGAETLSGSNTFTGAATIDAGASLRLAGAGGVAAASGVTANGTFDISATSSGAAITSLSGAGHVLLGDQTLVLTHASGAFAGDISGAGGLALTGGTQTLSGVNTYAGGARVTDDATLAVTSDAALGGSASGVALDGGVLLATGDLATARTILVAAQGGAIRDAGGVIDLSGRVILDGDLSTGGAGRINLSGLVQGNGALTIGEGSFYDNGVITAGAVTVAPGATLRGLGVINAPTTIGGTLAPGASPGTLTFNGPVTLLATAVSAFDIDGVGTGAGAGSHSRVIVTGAGGVFTAGGLLAPRLRGLTGSASNNYAPPIGQSFQVVSAAGGVAGGFAGLTQPDGLAAGTRFDAIYAPTSLSLVATPAAYGDLGALGLAQTSNQKAVGAALDADRPAAGVRMSAGQAAIYGPLYGLSAGQIPAALNGFSPEVYADGLMAVRQAWRQGADAVGDQLADRRAAPGRAAGPNEVTLWGGVFGQTGDTGPSGAGYRTTVGGLVAGVDRTLEGGGLLGFALSLSRVHADAAAGGGGARGDLVQAMVYGGQRWGGAFLDWRLDYLRTDQDLTRPGGPLRPQVAGGDTVQGAGARLGLGWDMTVARWLVEPTASLSVLGLNSTATDEAPGAALAETIAAQSNTSVQSFAGVRLARMVRLTPDLPLQVRGLFGWSHEMADARGVVQASLAGIGGAAFTVASAPAGRDAAKLGVSFSAQLTPRMTVYGAYTGDFAHEQDSQSLTTGVRVRW